MAAPNDVSDQWRSAAVVVVTMPAGQHEAGDYQRRDSNYFHHHERTLRASASFHAQTIDESQDGEGRCGDYPVAGVQTGEVQKVAGEGDGYGRHTSGIDDQQQHPAVKKCDRGMIGLAEVSVLTADCGKRGRQFSPNKSAAHSDNAAKNPGSQDQCWSMDLLRDDVGIYEDARTDDAAHDQHGGVKETKLTCQAWLRSGGVNCGR